jgi:hypothetical protein
LYGGCPLVPSFCTGGGSGGNPPPPPPPPRIISEGISMTGGWIYSGSTVVKGKDYFDSDVTGNQFQLSVTRSIESGTELNLSGSISYQTSAGTTLEAKPLPVSNVGATITTGWSVTANGSTSYNTSTVTKEQVELVMPLTAGYHWLISEFEKQEKYYGYLKVRRDYSDGSIEWVSGTQRDVYKTIVSSVIRSKKCNLGAICAW